ncbi:hypothetical protein, partial [Marilutibacter spongiae]
MSELHRPWAWLALGGVALLATGYLHNGPRDTQSEPGTEATRLAVADAVAAPATAATGDPLPEPAAGQRYYLRPDGGSPAQCSGTADAPYPGSGRQRACAWQSLHQALPADGPARIEGGDTLVLAPGEYMIGLGAPGTDHGGCDEEAPWDCQLAPVPSGPSADRPTRILGRDPAHPAVLWGNERVSAMLNLNGSSNVEIGHLEITDKSECVEFHATSAARCKRDSAPYGKWASSGITASNSRNVHLHDLDIHGLAN